MLFYGLRGTCTVTVSIGSISATQFTDRRSAVDCGDVRAGDLVAGRSTCNLSSVPAQSWASRKGTAYRRRPTVLFSGAPPSFPKGV